MMRALWTAGTGMTAQQTNIDVISNNLANVNTTGFKASRADFQDLMYQTIRQAGTATGPDSQVPSGIQLGSGVRQVDTQHLYTEGSPQQTGNSLDLMIEGDGFFQVTMPDGTAAYTRDGHFTNDSQGRIVTADGYPLQPAVTIPTNSTVTISADGRVSATVSGSTATQDLGQLQLVRFVNPAGLSSVGRNLLTETAASGAPATGNPGTDGTGTIQSQYLEMSNVQVVTEMVNMIVAQRAYEMNTKVITTCDDMLSQAAALKR
jgi:flagellar basal-body rod protein FlgG